MKSKQIPKKKAINLARSAGFSINNEDPKVNGDWERILNTNINDLLLEFNKNNSVESLCSSALDLIDIAYPGSHSAICLEKYTKSSRSHKYFIAASRGFNPENLNKIKADDLDSWIEKSLQSKKIREPAGKSNSPLRSAMSDTNISWIKTIPLRMSEERNFGILCIADFPQAQAVSENSRFFNEFVNHLSIVIHFAQEVFWNQIQAWTSSILLQAAETAQIINNIDDLFQTMVTLALLLAGVNRCGFFLYDPNKKVFTHIFSHKLDFKPYETIDLNDNPFLIPLVIDRTPQDLRNASIEILSEQFRFLQQNDSVHLIPLTSNLQLLGFMLVSFNTTMKDIVSSQMNAVTDDLLNGIVEQTSNALMRIRSLEEQEEDTYVSTVLSQVSQAMVNLNGIDEILETIINSLPIFIGIDYSVIMKWEEEPNSFTIWKLSSQNSQIEKVLLNNNISTSAFSFFESIRKSNSYKALELIDFYDSNQNFQQSPKKGYMSESPNDVMVGFPISYQQHFFGVLLIKESNIVTQFHEKRIQIMAGIAQQIALAIQNRKLLEASLESEKLQKEIQLARQIQLTFLPDTLLKLSGWNMAVRWITARQVGGDFYDYFYLDKNNIALVIADVADKGLPASLYMTVTRTLIRAYSKDARSPSIVLGKVNDQLLHDTPNSLFVTAALGFLCISSGIMTYTIAGHPLPIICRYKSKRFSHLDKCGMALGISEDALLSDKKVKVFSGDTLLFYSDGLTDTVNTKMDSYEDKRLYKLVKNKSFVTAEDALSLIEMDVRQFRGEAAVVDDLTMLGITRN